MIYTAGQLVTLRANYVTEAILAEELLAGSTYTSVETNPLPGPIVSGDIVTLVSVPNAMVILTASGTAALGATSIPVNSFTLNQNFSPGASLLYAIDPTVVEVSYYPGKNAEEVNLTYSPDGSGVGVIIRAAKGLYYVLLDSTSSDSVFTGLWKGAWSSTDTGQAYEQFAFTVEPALAG